MKKAIDTLKKTSDLIYDDWQLADIEIAMKEYACESCKEQREICAKKATLGKSGIGISLDSIFNAPKPELK